MDGAACTSSTSCLASMNHQFSSPSSKICGKAAKMHLADCFRLQVILRPYLKQVSPLCHGSKVATPPCSLFQSQALY